MEVGEFYQSVRRRIEEAQAVYPGAKLTIWFTPEDWDMLSDAIGPRDYRERAREWRREHGFPEEPRTDGYDIGLLHGIICRISPRLARGRVEIHAVVGTVAIGELPPSTQETGPAPLMLTGW